MKKILPIMALLALSLGHVFGQRPTTGNAAFDAELSRLLTETVPLVSVAELRKNLDKTVLLDAREPAEFAVSHIPGARFVGFKNFDPATVEHLPKDAPIVLYCSVGYRSGKVGKRLQKLGFTNVRNLYGSIFEWANEGFPLEDAEGKPTDELHTFNEDWSKWVENPKVKKVW